MSQPLRTSQGKNGKNENNAITQLKMVVAVAVLDELPVVSIMFSKRTTEVFIFDLVCTEQHIPAPWGYP